MTVEMRTEIMRLSQEGVAPHKIAAILEISDSVVRYVLDYDVERSKSHARVRRWRERRRAS